MKNSTTTTILTAVLFAATAALAQDPMNQTRTQQLRDVKQRIAGKASGEKGYPRAQLDQERLRVANLIDDLESGRQVDSSEIDRALERANRVGR